MAIRQNFSRRCPLFCLEMAHAHSVSAPLSHAFPSVVAVLLSLPALRLLPGQTPAHELSRFSLANGFTSGPTSANTAAAVGSCIRPEWSLSINTTAAFIGFYWLWRRTRRERGTTVQVHFRVRMDPLSCA